MDGVQTTWAQYLFDVTTGDDANRGNVTHDDSSNSKLSSIGISVAVPPASNFTMASTAPTIEDLEQPFPNTLIPKIQGPLTYKNPYKIQKLLMENVASVETQYGGGNHGHLGLVINTTRYVQEAGQRFIIPPNPGSTAIMPCQFMSKAEAETIQQNHRAALTWYYTVRNMDKALK
eukprot:5852190-Ditylum_brightwellii.AAC.1